MKSNQTKQPAGIERDIADLEMLDLSDLRDCWAGLWGAPPKLRSPDLLRRLIAWRIQATRYGGLTPQLRADIKRKGARKRRGTGLGEGAVLNRIWNGETIEVVVKGDRFVCKGEHYSSLSAVATAITGTRWNGARFFGLTKKDAAP